MATNLFQAPPIAPFNVEDPNNIAVRWNRWTKRLETYITATGITDDKQMRSLLLFCAGDAVHEIFDNLPGAQEAEDYKATLKLLTDHFSPKKIEHLKSIHFDKHNSSMAKALLSFILVSVSSLQRVNLLTPKARFGLK